MPVKVNNSKANEIKVAQETAAKEELCARVSEDRIAKLARGFEHEGTSYPMDVEAQGVYTALANAITAGIDHLNIIRTMANRTVMVNDAEMTAIGTACLNAAGAINIAAWTAKDSIRAAKTLEEAQAIFDSYISGGAP